MHAGGLQETRQCVSDWSEHLDCQAAEEMDLFGCSQSILSLIRKEALRKWWTRQGAVNSTKVILPMPHQIPWSGRAREMSTGLQRPGIIRLIWTSPPEMDKSLAVLLWFSKCTFEGNLWFGKESRDLLCLYLKCAHEKWKIEHEAGRKLHS